MSSFMSCILIQVPLSANILSISNRDLRELREVSQLPHTVSRSHSPRSNMRFISVPLCALVLASLVVALPVRKSLSAYRRFCTIC